MQSLYFSHRVSSRMELPHPQMPTEKLVHRYTHFLPFSFFSSHSPHFLPLLPYISSQMNSLDSHPCVRCTLEAGEPK
jgi:hypothetical protein